MGAFNTDSSVEVLRALDKIGAINLDLLVSRSGEVQEALGQAGLDLEPGDICYKFTMHIGPHFFDLVSVAAEVEKLGFQFNRAVVG